MAALAFVAELKGLDWLTVAAFCCGAGAAAGGWGLGILTDGRHILKLFWGQDVLILLIEDALEEAHNAHLTTTPEKLRVCVGVASRGLFRELFRES